MGQELHRCADHCEKMRHDVFMQSGDLQGCHADGRLLLCCPGSEQLGRSGWELLRMYAWQSQTHAQ